MVAGRGAWTPAGHPNGQRYYKHKLPIDGLFPWWDLNHQAVALGVGAIQRRLNDHLSYHRQKLIPVTNRFGVQTGGSTAWFQRLHDLEDDGSVGTDTAKVLWRPLILWYSGAAGVPPEHIFGMMYLESSFDPGAVGSVTPDRGLAQINLVAHPNITVEQAFDPHFALPYTTQRLASARAQFSGKTVALQRDCSILQHNSPRAAHQLYEIGWIGPDESGAKYIANVLKYAALF